MRYEAWTTPKSLSQFAPDEQIEPTVPDSNDRVMRAGEIAEAICEACGTLLGGGPGFVALATVNKPHSPGDHHPRSRRQVCARVETLGKAHLTQVRLELDMV